MTRAVREYLRVLDDLGVRVVGTTVTGSNHYRITVTYGGNAHFFIASRSPSDLRTLDNFRAMVRRWQRSTQERRHDRGVDIRCDYAAKR
jgi:hypothetical protein